MFNSEWNRINKRWIGTCHFQIDTRRNCRSDYLKPSKKVELQDTIDPATIVNYEISFLDNADRSKAVVCRKSKIAEKLIDTSKCFMFSIAASGTLLSLYILYKVDHIWISYTEIEPLKSQFKKSKFGWFYTNFFDEWFVIILLPYSLSDGPQNLIGDNLTVIFQFTSYLCANKTISNLSFCSWTVPIWPSL